MTGQIQTIIRKQAATTSGYISPRVILRLTEKQLELLVEALKDASPTQIGKELGVATQSIHTRIGQMLGKLEIETKEVKRQNKLKEKRG